MHVKMEDIARECGVTKMTVSRVLAGHPSVKPATRKKILETAKRFKYEPNALAKSFSSNRSGFIGIATPTEALLGGAYFAEMFKGFRLAINDDQGYTFALFDTNSESFNDGTKLAKLYRQKRVDGLLVVALHTHDKFLETLAEHHHVPMVVVGEKPPSPRVCSVSTNDEHGIELLASHLYSMGHRKIAFIEGPNEYGTAIRRKNTYTKFCKSKGLENPAWYCQPGNFSMDSGRAAGLVLLKARPRPTAIIAASDMMAFGAMESARELNLRVPQDVSVAGFDDLPSAAVRYPSLTTVHQPVLEIGQRGAKILQHSLDTGEPPTGQTVMEVSLVIRESTAAIKD